MVEVVQGSLVDGRVMLGERRVTRAVESGQTGWFYDRRENRAILNRLVAGKRVLDVFSYVGGWGIQAAAAGTARCIS